jgi:fructoselysine-6-P-deglycase FrlB-like protein
LSATATLASVTSEFNDQPSLLRSFRASAPWPRVEDGGDLVFVGAGDSYAASLCASFLAGPRAAAYDPYSLAESIGWAQGRRVYIVSVSGETRSNIELARSLKGVAERTTAVTCNPASRLAASADAVVELPFKPRSKSPGIASFALSLAAALRICGLDPDFEFRDVLSRAKALSKRILIARRPNVTHLTGNNEAYAASLYGAAKVYELLGGRAQASLLEEFSHMPLFSLVAGDTVNIIGTGEKEEQLHNGLRKGGYASSLVSLEGGKVERLFLVVFALQAAAIGAAKRAGLKAPYFLGAKRKLGISDEMIY